MTKRDVAPAAGESAGARAVQAAHQRRARCSSAAVGGAHVACVMSRGTSGAQCAAHRHAARSLGRGIRTPSGATARAPGWYSSIATSIRTSRRPAACCRIWHSGWPARGSRVAVVTSRQLYENPAASLPPLKIVDGVSVHRLATATRGRSDSRTRPGLLELSRGAGLRLLSWSPRRRRRGEDRSAVDFARRRGRGRVARRSVGQLAAGSVSGSGHGARRRASCPWADRLVGAARNARCGVRP